MQKDTLGEDKDLATKISAEYGVNLTTLFLMVPRIEKALSSRYADGYKAGLERAKEIATKYPRQYGCDGKHHGIGTLNCPFTLHHHHDERCQHPCDGISNAIQQELDGGVR